MSDTDSPLIIPPAPNSNAERRLAAIMADWRKLDLARVHEIPPALRFVPIDTEPADRGGFVAEDR
jgi:hypothetical protein